MSKVTERGVTCGPGHIQDRNPQHLNYKTLANTSFKAVIIVKKSLLQEKVLYYRKNMAERLGAWEDSWQT